MHRSYFLDKEVIKDYVQVFVQSFRGLLDFLEILILIYRLFNKKYLVIK